MNGRRFTSHSFGGGYFVERSTIQEGQDFFTYEPEDYDMIVSNPPFTMKNEVLKRLYELGKPFAILLPLNSLQGADRYKYFKSGIQLLSFDKRIGFHNELSMERYIKGASFATAYFCRNILPSDLIIEQLSEYNEPLIKAWRDPEQKEGEKSEKKAQSTVEMLHQTQTENDQPVNADVPLLIGAIHKN